MVIALNMMDEIRSNAGSIDIALMQKELGVPIVPISASKNEGITELINVAVKTVETRQTRNGRNFCTGAPHRKLFTRFSYDRDHAELSRIPRNLWRRRSSREINLYEGVTAY